MRMSNKGKNELLDKPTPWADPEGGTGDPDPPPHPTLKNYRNTGFYSNAGPDPLKITRLPSRDSMLGHHRHAS